MPPSATKWPSSIAPSTSTSPPSAASWAKPATESKPSAASAINGARATKPNEGPVLLNSIFLRRLLLPLVGVLGSALAIVAIVALVELSPETTSEIPHHRFVVVLIASLLAMTVALGWSALIIWRYRRIEGEAIGQALHKALSRSDA